MKRLAALLALLLLTACAAPPPPPPTVPRLTERAMITADGGELPVRSWLPPGRPRAVVAALHGFNDYSNAFALPAPSFTAAGIALYAYDQRGFGQAPAVGRWPGEAALQQDLYCFLRLLAARHPGTPLYVLGESMGGAVALTALSHPAVDRADLPPLAGVILVAPAVWTREQMPWYQDAALWLGDQLFPWLTLSGRGLHIQASDNIDMLRRLGRDPLVIKETRVGTIKGLCDLMDDAGQKPGAVDLPGLVLIGDHDEVVPAEASAALADHLSPHLQLRRYRQGYHMLLRDLNADQPLGDIVSWIAAS